MRGKAEDRESLDISALHEKRGMTDILRILVYWTRQLGLNKNDIQYPTNRCFLLISPRLRKGGKRRRLTRGTQTLSILRSTFPPANHCFTSSPVPTLHWKKRLPSSPGPEPALSLSFGSSGLASERNFRSSSSYTFSAFVLTLATGLIESPSTL
jgi:hypothetical protein